MRIGTGFTITLELTYLWQARMVIAWDKIHHDQIQKVNIMLLTEVGARS